MRQRPGEQYPADTINRRARGRQNCQPTDHEKRADAH
jgi:hypothetical protein